MKVLLGKRGEPLINFCIISAQQNGHDVIWEPHVNNSNLDEFYIEILNDYTYRAKDANFSPVQSGTYHFKGNDVFFVGDEQ